MITRINNRIQILLGIFTIFSGVLFLMSDYITETGKKNFKTKNNTEYIITPPNKYFNTESNIVFKDSSNSVNKIKLDSSSALGDSPVKKKGNEIDSKEKKWNYLKFVFGILFLLTLIFTFFYEWFFNKWLVYRTKKRNLNSSVIIETRKTVVDWYDYKNELTTFYEEIYFYKIGKLKSHLSTVKVDTGKIISNSIQNINCSYNLNNEQNHLTVHYENNLKNLNNKKSIIKRSKDFFIIKVLLEKGMVKGRDTWTLSAIQYCKFADIKIIFPKELEITLAKFVKLVPKTDKELAVDSRSSYKEIPILGIEPIRIRYNGRDGIFLKFTDIDVNEKYQLIWKTKKIS